MKFENFQQFLAQTTVIASKENQNPFTIVSDTKNLISQVELKVGAQDFTVKKESTPYSYPAHFVVYDYKTRNMYVYNIASREDIKELRNIFDHIQADAGLGSFIATADTVNPVLAAVAEQAKILAAQQAVNDAHKALVNAASSLDVAENTIKEINTRISRENAEYDKFTALEKSASAEFTALSPQYVAVNDAAEVAKLAALTRRKEVEKLPDVEKAQYEDELNKLDLTVDETAKAQQALFDSMIEKQKVVDNAAENRKKSDVRKNDANKALDEAKALVRTAQTAHIEAKRKKEDADAVLANLKTAAVQVKKEEKEEKVEKVEKEEKVEKVEKEEKVEKVEKEEKVEKVEKEEKVEKVEKEEKAKKFKIDQFANVIPFNMPTISDKNKVLARDAAFMGVPLAATWALFNLELFEVTVAPWVFTACVVPLVAGVAMREIFVMHERARYKTENITGTVPEHVEKRIQSGANYMALNFIAAYTATQVITQFTLSALSKHLGGTMVSGSPLEAQLVMMALAGVVFGATMAFVSVAELLAKQPKGQPIDWKAQAPKIAEKFFMGLFAGAFMHVAGMTTGLNNAYGHDIPGWFASVLATLGQLLAVAVPFAAVYMTRFPSFSPKDVSLGNVDDQRKLNVKNDIDSQESDQSSKAVGKLAIMALYVKGAAAKAGDAISNAAASLKESVTGACTRERSNSRSSTNSL